MENSGIFVTRWYWMAFLEVSRHPTAFPDLLGIDGDFSVGMRHVSYQDPKNDRRRLIPTKCLYQPTMWLRTQLARPEFVEPRLLPANRHRKPITGATLCHNTVS